MYLNSFEFPLRRHKEQSVIISPLLECQRQGETFVHNNYEENECSGDYTYTPNKALSVALMKGLRSCLETAECVSFGFQNVGFYVLFK